MRARACERGRLNIFIIITSLSDLRESESERARERRGIESIQRELELVEFERSLNAFYTSNPRTPLEYYLVMHVQRDREKRVLSFDVRRHIYDFIR